MANSPYYSKFSGEQIDALLETSANVPNKFGHCRVTADNILQFFASLEAQELYDTDPDSHPELLLGQTPIVTSGGGGGEQLYNLKVQNNLSTRQLYASVGASCFIDFTFVSQVKDDFTYIDTGERGQVGAIVTKKFNSLGEI